MTAVQTPLGPAIEQLPPHEEFVASAYFWAHLHAQSEVETDGWVYDMNPTWACLAENDR